MSAGRREGGLFLAGVVLIALAMRAPVSCVGPLVSFLKSDLGLDPAAAGLLTTIPLVVFSLMSPAAGRLVSVLGGKRFVTACLLLIAAASLLRSYLGPAGLFLGTALLGAAIGGLNVALPSLIRGRCGARLGLAMGLYSTSLALSSALASGFSLPVSGLAGGWQNGMALFSAPAVAAAALWRAAAGSPDTARQRRAKTSMRGLPYKKLLPLPLFMGLQSFLFFSMVMWFTSVLVSRGMPAAQASLLLLAVQVIGIFPNFLYPMAVVRSARRGRLAALSALAYLLGFLLLIVRHEAALLPAVLLLGIGNGTSISAALTLITLRGKDREQTARISAFTQTLGYAIGAPGPMLVGAVNGMTGGWTVPLLILAAVAALMGAAGRVAGNGTPRLPDLSTESAALPPAGWEKAGADEA